MNHVLKKNVVQENLVEQLQNTIKQQKIEIIRLKSVIDNLPGSIYWKDKNGVYQGRNSYSVEKMRRVQLEQAGTPNDIIGKTDYDFFPKSVADCYRKHDLQVMESRKELTMEEPVLLPNGKTIVQLSTKQPLYDENGRIIGIVGNTVDITDRKRAEELEKKNEIANQVIQRLKTISAGLSYEIRGPLAGIRLGLGRTNQLFAKLLRFVKSMGGRIKSSDDDEVSLEELMEYQRLLDKMVHRIDASVALMDMQLKNMMTDRIKQRFFQPQKIKYSIEQAVKTFPLVDEALRDKIQLNVHHDFSVCGDALLTKHLLWNLLHNALHTIQAEGRGEVIIKTEEMTEHHLLRFKDTAGGMPSIPVDGRLKPFDTGNNGNNGLGLHFCQLVTKAYDGKFECYAKEGQYTEFLLFFPKEFALESESTFPETEICAS